jgi:prefoldin subunit 5
MATASRIYIVTDGIATIGLVRARSQAEAIRHCTAGRFLATVADQDQLIAAIGAGITVENATQDNEAA